MPRRVHGRQACVGTIPDLEGLKTLLGTFQSFQLNEQSEVVSVYGTKSALLVKVFLTINELPHTL